MIKSTRTTAIPPGAVIRDRLDSLRMSQKELAARTGSSEKNVCLLMQGKAPLTPQTAKKLEMVFNEPADSWLMMESLYRSDLMKIEYENGVDADSVIAGKMDYQLMARLGWVPEADNRFDRVMNLRHFFEVSDLGILNSFKFVDVSCLKRGKAPGKTGLMRLAWCQKARIEARKQKLVKYNAARLRSKIKDLRMLACAGRPDLGGMLEVLNACGIALIVMPYLPEAGIQGASFPAGSTAVIALAGNLETAYEFSLGFFFETSRVFSGDFDADGTMFGSVCPALEYAHGQLIAPAAFKDFAKKGDFSREATVAFAKEFGVDPGIVAGRLRSEGRVKGEALADLLLPFEF